MGAFCPQRFIDYNATAIELKQVRPAYFYFCFADAGTEKLASEGIP